MFIRISTIFPTRQGQACGDCFGTLLRIGPNFREFMSTPGAMHDVPRLCFLVVCCAKVEHAQADCRICKFPAEEPHDGITPNVWTLDTSG
jgi:hypothetical protein